MILQKPQGAAQDQSTKEAFSQGASPGSRKGQMPPGMPPRAQWGGQTPNGMSSAMGPDQVMGPGPMAGQLQRIQAMRSAMPPDSAGFAGPQTSSSMGLADPRMGMARQNQQPMDPWSAFAAGQGPRPRGMVPSSMAGSFGPQVAQVLRGARPGMRAQPAMPMRPTGDLGGEGASYG